MKNLSVVISLCVLFIGGSLLFAESPDYGNDSTTAFVIPTDNTEIYGILDEGDADWFKFLTDGFTRYKITFTNPNGNWKMIHIYQADEFGIVREITNWWACNGSSYQTFFLEFPYDGFLAVTNESGNYSVQVEKVGATPADSFSNSCDTASQLIVDAAATVGTLDHSDPYDTDWFYFETQPLHMYRIMLTGVNNTSVWFGLYSADCGTQVYGNTSDMTLTSWAGETYKINVNGNVNLGNYYTIQVIDIETFTDDVANLPKDATPVAADGTEFLGTINYNSSYYSDVDWFTFTPEANTKYRIIFTNYNSNWKMPHVYQRNNVGDLLEVLNWWSCNDTQARTLFFEFSRECLIQVTNEGGDYGIKIETQETQIPDTYSNDCVSSQTITADSTTIGTLDHTIPYDTDWFVFHTQPLHMYRITLSNLDNTSIWFSLYSADCGTQVYGNNNDVTVTSWDGEDYKIYVNGDINRVGNYYIMNVSDIAANTDDYGNTWQEAVSIAKDGSWIDCRIDYNSSLNSDLDWFKFTAPIDGSYVISFHNIESNWKMLHLYSSDAAGRPVEIANWWACNGTTQPTVSLTAGQYYIMVGNDGGYYRFNVLSPEPRCGDLEHPIMDGDVNKDCFVNLEDVAMLAGNWLKCNSPASSCEN